MASSAMKVLIVPALISMAIFLGLTFGLLPIWRRYRNRYSQYLPLDAISDHTASIRGRLTARFTTLLLPSTWRRDREIINAAAEEEELEDGEELSAVDAAAVAAYERQMGESRLPDIDRRLSRDLEEGFIDDSDDDDNGDLRQH